MSSVTLFRVRISAKIRGTMTAKVMVVGKVRARVLVPFPLAIDSGVAGVPRAPGAHPKTILIIRVRCRMRNRVGFLQ